MTSENPMATERLDIDYSCSAEPIGYEHEFEAYKADMKEWEELNKFKPAISVRYLVQRPRVPIKEYCPKLIAAGAITCLAGDPKAGKSTLMFHALNSVVNNAAFLDGKCSAVNVLHATQQTEVSFREQIDKVPSIANNERFRVILFENNKQPKPTTVKVGDQFETIEVPTAPVTWEDQIELWRKAVKLNNAKILVIDTWTAFGNFKAGEAFDPGVVQSRGQALKALISDVPELAIVILHHLRKESPQQNEKGARSFSDMANSYALRAFTDQNILIYKPSSNIEQKNVRTIVLEGRLVDEEDDFQVRLTDDGFRLVETPIAEANEQERILAEVIKDPKLNDLSIRDLMDAIGAKKNQVERFRKTWKQGTTPTKYLSAPDSNPNQTAG